MLLKYLFYSFIATFKLILCESIQITLPSNGDEYEVDHAMLIEWYVHRDNNRVNDPVTIVLASGAAQNLTIDRIITNKTASILGCYSWVIPRDIPSRNDYVIEVGITVNNIAFAGYITIKNKNIPGVVNSNVSTTFTSLLTTTPIRKPSAASILTAYSPVKTAAFIQEPKETIIFLNSFT